jgi:hypothetical protein
MLYLPAFNMGLLLAPGEYFLLLTIVNRRLM